MHSLNTVFTLTVLRPNIIFTMLHSVKAATWLKSEFLGQSIFIHILFQHFSTKPSKRAWKFSGYYRN